MLSLKRTRRARALANGIGSVVEEMERRVMLTTTVDSISSDLGNTRFLTGSGLVAVNNAFRAQVTGSASRVVFDLGGQTVEDTDSSDGWSAGFNMSTLSVDSTLNVTAYQGGSALHSKNLSVQMTALPSWMSNVQFTSQFDPANGYTFDVTKLDLDYGFNTPASWDWTPTPFFTQPLVKFGNLRTGFEAGWHFKLISSPAGTVSVQDTGYHLQAEVVGKTIWEYNLSAGTNGSFNLGPASGSYSISFNPTFNNNLNWIAGVSATATLNLTIAKTVPLASAHVPFGPSLPFLAELAAIDLGLEAGVSIGLSGSVTAAITGSGISLSSANIHPNVAVSLIGSAEGSIGNILGFSAAKAGVDVTGRLNQDFTANYSGGTWTYDAPGSLNLSGKLHWDALFGLWSGSKDAFNWDMASWNFVSPSGVLPAVATQPSTPAPTITSITPNSFTGLPSAQRTPLVIRGTGFLPTSQVEWSTGGTVYPLKGASDANFQYISATELRYAISTGTTEADWHLRVKNPDVPPSAPLTFHVNAPANARPSATLSYPSVGGTVTAASINATKYIDVTFNASGGLNAATILDSDAEFSLVGTAAANVQIVSGVPTDQGSNRYRYAITGDFGAGSVSVNFIAGRWADNAGQLNETVIQSFTVIASGTDTTAPVISGVGSSAASTTALITWTTNELATTQVEYDTNTTSYHSLYVKNTALTTTHSITLPNLAPATTYYFRVWSVDGAGNQSYTTNYSVTTLPSGSTGLGSLQVSVAPQAAADAGAQWQVDGGNFRASGSVISGLTPGNHTIRFKTITGWSTPADQTINVVAGQTITGVGTYSQQSSSYTLMILSDNGNVFRDITASNYPAGSQVKLTAVANSGYHFAGWSGDASGTANPLTITMNGNKGVTALFAAGDMSRGSVRVTINPEAVAAGARWRLDGGAWMDSGATISNEFLGDHYVEFSAASGFANLGGQSIKVYGGQTTTVTGTYIALAQTSYLQVTLGPSAAVSAGAKWRVDGGAWQNSAATLSNIAAGDHTLEFSAATGFVAPVSKVVRLTGGQTTLATGDYQVATAAPMIYAVTPDTGSLAGGTQVLIDGVNFSSAPIVKFGGTPGTNVQLLTANRIQVTAPPRATFGSVDVSVVVSGGIATKPNSFTYIAPRGRNLELLGHIGGYVDAVAYQGSYAYIGEGAGLSIVSVSNPAAPAVVGRIGLPDLPQDIVVSGGYAYVITQDSGLFVVDVSNPAAPGLRGFYDTPDAGLSLAVLGGRAYVAVGGTGLMIFDLANPTAPALISTLPTPNAARDVEVVANANGVFAYIADSEAGLLVADVTDPVAPRIRGTYDTPGVAGRVAAGAAGYVFVADGVMGAPTGSNIQAINVSNPDAPVFIKTYSSPQTSGPSYGVAYANNRVYEMTYFGITAYNVTNPASPVHLTHYFSEYTISRAAPTGNLVYAAAGRTGMQVLDFTSVQPPTNPGRYIAPASFANDLMVSGTTVYLSGDKSLDILDVATPSAPAFRGSSAITGGGIGKIALANNRAYIANGSFLTIHDVSVPNNPRLVGTYPQNTMVPSDVAVVGNFAYLAGISSTGPRFEIVDVSNPAVPTLRSAVDGAVGDNSYSAVAVFGSNAYVTLFPGKLQVINISNPNSPSVQGVVSLMGYARSIAMSADGRYAYCGGNGYLQIVDIQNASSPTIVATYSPGNTIMDISVSGTLIYLAALGTGVQVLDVSNPAAPTRVAEYDTPGGVFGVAVQGDTVYVADATGGLSILRLQDYTPPTITITNPTFTPTYTTTTPTLNIGGGATDDRAVTRVTWANDRGGSGDASGTDSWFATSVVLQGGVNVITVTAYDSEGNTATDVITVTCNLPISPQTISFPALSAKTYGDAPFSLNATSTSGLPVSFSIVSGPGSISGNTLTITGAGTVVVRASQAGDSLFSPATSVDQSFAVAKAIQALVVAPIPDKSFGDDAFTVTAASSSTLPVTFSVVSGPAVVSGGMITLLGAGTVVLRASQAGNLNYLAAADVERSIVVAKAEQTISFGTLTGQLIGDAPFPLFATSSSGLPVSFSIVSGQATLSGNILTLTGVAPVVVRASQPGNGDYLQAAAVDQTFTVGKLLEADADLSGTVNFFDLTTLAANYGSNNKGWADGDFNGDGAVNFFDLTALAANYGANIPAPAPVAAPIPAAPVTEVPEVIEFAATAPVSATVTAGAPTEAAVASAAPAPVVESAAVTKTLAPPAVPVGAPARKHATVSVFSAAPVKKLSPLPVKRLGKPAAPPPAVTVSRPALPATTRRKSTVPESTKPLFALTPPIRPLARPKAMARSTRR